MEDIFDMMEIERKEHRIFGWMPEEEDRFMVRLRSVLSGAGAEGEEGEDKESRRRQGMLRAAENGWGPDELGMFRIIAEKEWSANKKLADCLNAENPDEKKLEKINSQIEEISRTREAIDKFKEKYWMRRVLRPSDKAEAVLAFYKLCEEAGNIQPDEEIAELRTRLIDGEFTDLGTGDREKMDHLCAIADEGAPADHSVSRQQYAYIILTAAGNTTAFADVEKTAEAGKETAAEILAQYLQGQTKPLAELLYSGLKQLSEEFITFKGSFYGGNALYYYGAFRAFAKLLSDDRALYEDYKNSAEDGDADEILATVLKYQCFARVFVCAEAARESIEKINFMKEMEAKNEENKAYLAVLNNNLGELISKYIPALNAARAEGENTSPEAEELLEKMSGLVEYLNRAKEVGREYEALAATHNEYDKDIDIIRARLLEGNILDDLKLINADREKKGARTRKQYEFFGTPGGIKPFEEFAIILNQKYPTLADEVLPETIKEKPEVRADIGCFFFGIGKKEAMTAAGQERSVEVRKTIAISYIASVYMEWVCSTYKHEILDILYDVREEFEERITEFADNLRYDMARPEDFAAMLEEGNKIFVSMSDKIMLFCRSELFNKKRDKQIEQFGKMPDFNEAITALSEGKKLYGEGSEELLVNELKYVNNKLLDADKAYEEKGIYLAPDLVEFEKTIYDKMEAYAKELSETKLEGVEKVKGEIRLKTVEKAMRLMKTRMDFDADAPQITIPDTYNIKEYREYIDFRKNSGGVNAYIAPPRRKDMLDELMLKEENERSKHFAIIHETKNRASVYVVETGKTEIRDEQALREIKKAREAIINSVVRSLFLDEVRKEVGTVDENDPDGVVQFEKNVKYALKKGFAEKLPEYKQIMMSEFSEDMERLLDDFIDSNMYDHLSAVRLLDESVLARYEYFLAEYKNCQLIGSPKIAAIQKKIESILDKAYVLGSTILADKEKPAFITEKESPEDIGYDLLDEENDDDDISEDEEESGSIGFDTEDSDDEDSDEDDEDGFEPLDFDFDDLDDEESEEDENSDDEKSEDAGLDDEIEEDDDLFDEDSMTEIPEDDIISGETEDGESDDDDSKVDKSDDETDDDYFKFDFDDDSENDESEDEESDDDFNLDFDDDEETDSESKDDSSEAENDDDDFKPDDDIFKGFGNLDDDDDILESLGIEFIEDDDDFEKDK